jgi:hypothetical protein
MARIRRKNRRVHRRHVLDVKLRSQLVRRGRLRWAGLLMSSIFVTILLLFTLWRGGEWMLGQLIYENDAFAIKEIELSTDGVIAPAHLQSWARVNLGDNLLALNLARVKQDLEFVPQIRSATIGRQLPDTLTIRVSERRPMARLQVTHPEALGDGRQSTTYHVTDDGHVVPPLDPKFMSRAFEWSDKDLPLLTGLAPLEVRPGRSLQSLQVEAAIRLIDEFRRSALAGRNSLWRIDVSTPEVLTVLTGDGSEITFSARGLQSYPLALQLRRWQTLHEFWRQEGKSIATLDLSITNHVPAVPVQSVVQPLSSRKSSTPTRNLKDHV